MRDTDSAVAGIMRAGGCAAASGAAAATISRRVTGGCRRSATFRRINAYSPFPIEELSEAIGYHHDYVALCTLICGVLGVNLHEIILEATAENPDRPRKLSTSEERLRSI